jgi:2-polyprenyl-3-methyl-5-hydroxy-6-metoxy-1,4-benzoquinol methylase
MNPKFKYLVRSAYHYLSPIKCTNCGSQRVEQSDRKYFFTRLFECQDCKLQFRHPVDTKAFNEKFYQEDYVQDDGITTDLPSTELLKQMVNSNFANSPKNADPVLALWKSVFSDLRQVKAIDYGCSWGYMSFQFLKQGVQLQSYEISRPRAKFGNAHLGLSIKSDVKDLTSGNDLFYNSHVIEHVPSISDMVNEAKRLLKPNGYFFAECPNGSLAFRKKNPSEFHQGWGLVHPNYLSDKFYQHLFRECPYLISSAPFPLEAIREWDGNSQQTLDTSGGQLLVIARPNMPLV